MENIFDKNAEYIDSVMGEKLGSFSHAISRYRVDIVKNILSKPPKNILEFGCGIGRNIEALKNAFPNSNIYGCDASEKSLEIASKKHPNFHFSKTESADDLGIYTDKNIDLVFINCVLHHIPRNEHDKYLKKLREIMTSCGVIIIFEMNTYNPLSMYLVKNCPWDKDAVMLKPKYCKSIVAKQFGTEFEGGGGGILLSYSYFLPFRNKLVNKIEQYLWWLPLGGQYFVLGEKNEKK